MADNKQRERIGNLIYRRRAQLGLTQQDASAKAKVGTTTWRDLERGKPGNYRGATLYAMAGVLGWPIDAIERMLNGEPPSKVVPDAKPPPAPSIDAKLDAIEGKVDEAVALLRTLVDSAPGDRQGDGPP